MSASMPSPYPTADWPEVRARLAARIDRIERRMYAASDHASAVAYRANPELDVGGIRSRTARQRARETATYDRAARIVVDGVRERDRLKVLLRALDDAIRLAPDMRAALDAGEVSGVKLTGERREAVRALVVGYGRTFRAALAEARRA